MKLPQPVSDYFAADTDLDGEPPTRAFAPGGVVTDEGRTHEGHAAIAGWWRAAKQKYRHTAEPFELHEAGGVTRVRAMVTGDFPGSPAPLTYLFTLDDGKIARLQIGA